MDTSINKIKNLSSYIMKKLLLILSSVFLLSSCNVIKLVSDKKNHRNVIIVDKWSPIDSYELKTYPIRDTKSFAIGFQELGGATIKYARDLYGDIYDNFKIGDTITVVLFSK